MVELFRDFQFADLSPPLLARVLRERPELLTDFDWVVLFHRTGDWAWLDRVKNYEKALKAASQIGSVPAAQWAWDHGARNVDWAMWRAAEGGHLEIVQWAYDMGARDVEWAMALAARHGHPEVETWLREQQRREG